MGPNGNCIFEPVLETCENGSGHVGANLVVGENSGEGVEGVDALCDFCRDGEHWKICLKSS